MARWPGCGGVIRATSALRCPFCGVSLAASETRTASAEVLARDPDDVPDLIDPSSTGILDARFVPGRIFAARFRIVSLLGRGAIGEVYRADDLRLGQPGLGRIVLRRTWLAVLLLLVLNVLLSAWSWTPTALFYAIGIAGLFCFVVLQLGLLAGVAMLAISRVLTSLPLTLDFDAWYVASSASVLLLVLAVSVLAFRMTIRRDRVEMPVGVHQAHQQVR